MRIPGNHFPPHQRPLPGLPQKNGTGGYRETISRRTNARCPVCHKKMELVGKGDAQRFVCSCGHKEKLSAFQERKKKEGKGAGKRDVAAYMRKQEKETNAPINNAFAEAFKNLKL